MSSVKMTITGKLVVLGDQGVGKTSVVCRYIKNTFDTYVSPTIGATYLTCNINIGDVLVKLHVWDTAGQERFKAMAPIFYRKANAALLVFDITRLESFENVKFWSQELKRNIQEPINICVIGNKVDLSEERDVMYSEALQYANSIGASYFECSAKDNQGMEQIFLHMATAIIKLSHNADVNSLKMYDGNVDSAGRIERPGLSTDAIAHAHEVQTSKCYPC